MCGSSGWDAGHMDCPPGRPSRCVRDAVRRHRASVRGSRMDSTSTIVTVNSIAEEDSHLGKCECGGAWSLASEDVLPLHGRWLDALVMRCDLCARYRRGLFDITSFFHPPTRSWWG